MSDNQTLALGGTPTITVHAADLAPVEELVREVTLSGAEEFYASYVVRELGISAAMAQGSLCLLAEKGILETRFNVVHPQTGQTLATYGLGDSIPIEEEFASEDESFEPFILVKSDILIAFAPTFDFLRRVLREESWKTRQPVEKGEVYAILDDLEAKHSKIVDAPFWQRSIKDREQANGAVAACCEIRSRVEALGTDKASVAPETFA